MTKKLISLAAGTAIAALVLTGCGTADSESGTSILTVKASFDDGSWTMESVKETPNAELPAE